MAIRIHTSWQESIRPDNRLQWDCDGCAQSHEIIHIISNAKMRVGFCAIKSLPYVRKKYRVKRNIQLYSSIFPHWTDRFPCGRAHFSFERICFRRNGKKDSTPLSILNSMPIRNSFSRIRRRAKIGRVPYDELRKVPNAGRRRRGNITPTVHQMARHATHGETRCTFA
jgi:hypothetical protein